MCDVCALGALGLVVGNCSAYVVVFLFDFRPPFSAAVVVAFECEVTVVFVSVVECSVVAA